MTKVRQYKDFGKYEKIDCNGNNDIFDSIDCRKIRLKVVDSWDWGFVTISISVIHTASRRVTEHNDVTSTAIAMSANSIQLKSCRETHPNKQWNSHCIL